MCKELSTEKLIGLYQSCDKSSKLLDKIYRAVEDLIAFNTLKAYKLSNLKQIDLEDLLSNSKITFMKCVELFDISKKTKFSTYLQRSILSNTLKYLKKETAYYKKNILVENVKINKKCYIDTSIFNMSDVKKISSIFNCKNKDGNYLLTNEEQNFLIDYYGLFGIKRLTTKEICDKLNISKRQIYYVRDRIINKIKGMYL